MNPITPREREPILDALRGFAILGILLVNIEVMRGPGWLLMVGGGSVAPANEWDRIVRFAIGWLGTGKFLSTLAMLFGAGAALIAARALDAGTSPRALLARRYGCLMLFGIAHMLLYPGDILFLYGVTGVVLLIFVRLSVPSLLFWSAAMFAAYTAWGLSLMSSVEAASDTAWDPFVLQSRDLAEYALAAFRGGSWGDVFAAQASQALLLQPLQLTATPWVLALFLLGFAVARAGIATRLRDHRVGLARVAWIGLAVGVPANFGLGFDGPLSGWGPPAEALAPWAALWADVGQLFGEPVLAIGYVCALASYWLRRGAPQRLVAVGRMALTVYVFESALALAVFAGLGLYGQLSTAAAMIVVGCIWTIALIACPLWLRRFRMGPVEWLWRRLTYGRLPQRIGSP